MLRENGTAGVDGERIVILSDLHYGHDGLKHNDDLGQIRDMIRNRVDHVVLAGDLIEDDADYEEHVDRLTAVEFKLSRPGTDLHIVPGNHDARAVPKERFYEITETEPNTEIELETGDYTLALVDTAYGREEDNVGWLGGETREFIRGLDDETIVVSHHPIFYTDAYQDSTYFPNTPQAVFPIDNYDLLLAKDAGNIAPEHFVAGHVHEGFDDKWYLDPCLARQYTTEPIIDFGDDDWSFDGIELVVTENGVIGDRL